MELSKLDKFLELYDPTNKKVIGKMKIERSPVLVLVSFTALQSKSYTFSYNNIRKAKQKGIQKAAECQDYIRCLFKCEYSRSKSYSICSNLHLIWVKKQNKTN